MKVCVWGGGCWGGCWGGGRGGDGGGGGGGGGVWEKTFTAILKS